MEKGVVLRANNIKKEFNNHVVLDGISFAIEQDEIFGLIGVSGCGKTTLLHTFVGFYEPEEGDILLVHDNKEISLHDNLVLARKKFGFAPQHPSFYPHLTVAENLEHFGILYGLDEEEIEQQIEKLLLLTRLTTVSQYLSHHLSYGMQKRLGIACALIHKPSILLLDEPTADLDPLMRKEIWKLVKRINETGTTIIIASHLLGEVEAMCTRIGMLHAGKLVYVGTFEEMKRKYAPRQEVTLKTSSHMYDHIISLLGRKGVPSFTSSDHLHITTTDPEQTINVIVQHVKDFDDKIVSLHVAPPTLEEIFALIEEEK